MNNKYFSILGDSISTLEGYSEPAGAEFYDTANKIASGVLVARDTWWGRVIDHFGGKLSVNNSFSGSTVCRISQYEIESYSCSKERTSSLSRNGIIPDVIMVYMGTNAWGRGIDISRMRYGEGEKEYLFSTAYETMLERIKAKYPDAEIWCLTLAVSKCRTVRDFSFPYSYSGRHIAEYCDAIRHCAEKYGCRLIDLYNNCEPYDTIDGFHPNADGMKTIAEGVIDEIERDS